MFRWNEIAVHVAMSLPSPLLSPFTHLPDHSSITFVTLLFPPQSLDSYIYCAFLEELLLCTRT